MSEGAARVGFALDQVADGLLGGIREMGLGDERPQAYSDGDIPSTQSEVAVSRVM